MCKWIINLGALNHMISYRATFDTYEVIAPYNVHLGGDNIIEAIGLGTVGVEVMMKDEIKRICIKNVFRVPNLQTNLLSVNKLLSNGLYVQFNLNECVIE